MLQEGGGFVVPLSPGLGEVFPSPVLQFTFPGAHPEHGEFNIHLRGCPEPQLQPLAGVSPLRAGRRGWSPGAGTAGRDFASTVGHEPCVSPSSACGRKALLENYFSWGKRKDTSSFFLYVSLFRINWENIWAPGQYELVSFLYPDFW